MAGELILVVDDGQDMREFVTNYVLKPNGYDWLEARDGLEAFELILEHNPDLILLDLQMPRLDGIGLLNKLRDHGVNIPVVLMTFYGSEEIAIEVFRRGVRDYVIKPFTDEELLKAIEGALTEVRLRRERDALTERLVISNRDLQRRVRELQALHGVGRLVADLVDPDTLLARIVEAAALLTNAVEARIFVYDEGSDKLLQRAAKTDDRAAWPAQGAGGDLLVQQVMQQGQPLIGEPGPSDEAPGTIPMAAPLTLGRMTIGALSVLIPSDLAAEYQIKLLGALADYAAVGLERARLAAALDETQYR